MRKKVAVFFYFSMFAGSMAYAQFSENFTDGDFTHNGTWVGNTGDFTINTAYQLQSRSEVANSGFFLSTESELATAVQWIFWVRIAFNPSSANYVDTYLTASDSNLSLQSTTGYFVRIGNTDDEISLYRKDAAGKVTKIIDGENGILNRSNNEIRMKVTRDASGEWILYRDIGGSGNNYFREGEAIDTTYLTSACFGFFIKQSSAGFFKKHFFDDIEVARFVPDITPPMVQTATATSDTTVDVFFNEPLDRVTSGQPYNYYADAELGIPGSAVPDAANSALVHLTFGTKLNNGISYSLSVNAVKDLAGNALINGSSTFSFYTAQQYDVIIDEVFPDPSPSVGLSLFKFLELKNVSRFPVNLQGWKLIDGASAAILPSFNLLPDSFVIVCASNAVTAFTSYGSVLGVADFPAMNIGGALIILQSSTNKTIHAVQYEAATYKNELKKEGGWTLEIIDPKNPCTGINNWNASVDVSGGTPGRKNSIDAINKDEASPKLLRAFAVDSSAVTLVFDEPVDSMKAAVITNYIFDKELSAVNAYADLPLFNKVTITLNHPLMAGTIYTVTVNGISDCSQNSIGAKNSSNFGMPRDAGNLDLVVNEILFDPFPMGIEFVEIYNRSSKIIELNKVFIANRNNSNVISNIKQLTAENILLFPAEFMVLSEDQNAIKNQYITTTPDAFLNLKSMPAFPNENGNVIVLNNQGNIVDEVIYSEKWHFPLLHNTKGVSLERIDYNGPSVQSNFHSAATSAGYATPGYKNSQYKSDKEAEAQVSITPEIFSPDNDGTDDFATVNYHFPSPGYMANITIFDATGRPVRYLQKNSLSGIKGYYRWDGLDDKNRKLPQGIYIIYTEIFNTEGKKRQFKNTIVLARRF